MQDVRQSRAGGADGLVEATHSTQFGPRMYKWAQTDESLDGEAEALSLLQGRHVVHYYGRCKHEGRHPGKTGLVIERMQKTLWEAIKDPASFK